MLARRRCDLCRGQYRTLVDKVNAARTLAGVCVALMDDGHRDGRWRGLSQGCLVGSKRPSVLIGDCASSWRPIARMPECYIKRNGR